MGNGFDGAIVAWARDENKLLSGQINPSIYIGKKNREKGFLFGAESGIIN